MQRPIGVTILAILCFVFAALAVLGALALFAGGAMLSQLGGQQAGFGAMLVGLGMAGAVIVLVLGGVYALMGWGLWSLKNWARILTIVFVALGLISALLGVFSSLSPLQVGVLIWQLIVCAIDIWIITYLLKPHVKQAFGTA